MLPIRNMIFPISINAPAASLLALWSHQWVVSPVPTAALIALKAIPLLILQHTSSMSVLCLHLHNVWIMQIYIKYLLSAQFVVVPTFLTPPVPLLPAFPDRAAILNLARLVNLLQLLHLL